MTVPCLRVNNFLQGSSILDNRGIKRHISVVGSSRAHRDHPTLSIHYKEAYDFAHAWTEWIQREQAEPLPIFTGGGPGIMHAANLGAMEAGGLSGAICCHFENEEPNTASTSSLRFKIDNFPDRQRLLVERSAAMVAFCGGEGTASEVTQFLVSVQTKHVPFAPLILVGEEVWDSFHSERLTMLKNGTISENHFNIFSVVPNANAALRMLKNYIGRSEAA